MNKILGMLALALLASGCARNMASNAYTASATPGKVLEGTVVSARAVTIKAHDKLQDNTTGGLIGGAAGGIAGASAGRGWGQAGAGLGGAVAGAVVGALVEDALSTSEGMEYIVKLKTKMSDQPIKKSKHIYVKGSQSVEDDMKADIGTETTTDIVSVVQETDQQIHEGSHVYVVYNDDRPRLVPAKD